MTNGILAQGFNMVGFGLGKLMSNLLSLLHKLVGGLVDRLISTRLQRLAFVGFGRFNAPGLTVAGLIAFWLTAWNHPAGPASDGDSVPDRVAGAQHVLPPEASRGVDDSDVVLWPRVARASA